MMRSHIAARPSWARAGPTQVTRRGVALGAAAALLAFSLMQSVFVCLATTTAEARNSMPAFPSTRAHVRRPVCTRRAAQAMVAALHWYLRPLGAVGAAIDELALLLLLALRFLSLARAGCAPPPHSCFRPMLASSLLDSSAIERACSTPQVFEEARNIALGVSVRGIDWKALGGLGTLGVAVRLAQRLLQNLFGAAEQAASAMRTRGYRGPGQALAAMRYAAPLSLGWRDAVALLCLAATVGAVAVCGRAACLL